MDLAIPAVPPNRSFRPEDVDLSLPLNRRSDDGRPGVTLTQEGAVMGTARYMAANRDKWSGKLMLVVQPAEERVLGARAMRDDDIWGRFGKPDYALAFHVNSLDVAGKVNITDGSPFAGADTVDIIIHGVGAHGAVHRRR